MGFFDQLLKNPHGWGSLPPHPKEIAYEDDAGNGYGFDGGIVKKGTYNTPMTLGETALATATAPAKIATGLASTLSPYGSEGWQVPPVISEPIAAGNRLLNSGGFPDPQDPQNQQDAVTSLLAFFGANAFNPIPKGALASNAVRSAANVDPAAVGTGISQALRHGEGVPSPSQQLSGQMAESPQGHSQFPQSQQGLEGQGLMTDGKSLASWVDPESFKRLYHGRSEEYPKAPLTHLGTLKAANDRLLSFDAEASRIYPVDFWPGNTIEVADNGLGNPIELARSLYDYGHLDDVQLASVVRKWYDTLDAKGLKQAGSFDDALQEIISGVPHRVVNKRGDQREFHHGTMADPAAYLASVLKEGGIDSINYRNTVEDPGSTSYITVSPGTVRSATSGETLFSDTSKPSLLGSAIAAEQSKTPGITAYHGSPHDFDKFDLSKIGTGEGAQAYGHGLYFAENEGVAKIYRDQLSRNDGPAQTASWALQEAGNNAAAAIEKVRGSMAWKEANGGITEADRSKHLEAIRRIESGRVSPGHMYQVKINANPEDFLDWDKPLSQQSEKVRNAVVPMLHENERMASPDYVLGKDAILSMQANEWPRFKDRSEVSPQLREAGIPGIRYLDGNSRGVGEGSSNYVVFDDNLIEILKKYGIIPGLYGASQASQMGDKRE